MRKSPGITSYSGAHVQNTRVRGKASNYQCSCGMRALEWALNHDAPAIKTDARGLVFSVNPFDYMPMCARCHRLYDKSHITRCPHGHEYTEGNTIIDAGKRKCRTCVYARNRKRKPSPAQQQRRTELQRIRRQRAKEQAA